MMYGYGVGHSFGLGEFIFGGVFTLIFWVFIVWLVVMFIRGGTHNHGKGFYGMHGEDGKSDAAMDLLRQRFAKGEISKEEFEEKKKVLEGEKINQEK